MLDMGKIKFLLLESDKFYRKRKQLKVEIRHKIKVRKHKGFEIWRYTA